MELRSMPRNELFIPYLIKSENLHLKGTIWLQHCREPILKELDTLIEDRL